MNAPKKKRKLNEPLKNPPMSAVAARRAKEAAKTQALNDLPTEKTPSKSQKKFTVPVVLDEPTIAKSLPAEVTTRASPKQGSFAPDQLDEVPTSSTESRAESPEVLPDRSNVVLSTFRPSEETNNFKELKNGGLSIRLAPGERLVLVGQFEMTILRGEVTLLGATLRAANKSYTIYAPSSHSLPVVRCLAVEVDDAEIVFRQHKSGLESLQSLSPLFGKLWGGEKSPFGSGFEALFRNKKPTTYQILFSTDDSTSKSYLQPLVSPPQWNAMLSKLADSDRDKAPITMICGPKSSGKSTFTRLLTNKFLLSTSSSQKAGVAILDLDSGQPEYSLPGQLSLTHLLEPNFGPPFTHPKTSSKSRTIRSHAIAAVSPALNPNLYTACALDLFIHYRVLLSNFPGCPLILNTPGWVLGTGLEILMEMITKVRPTEVIYMSEEGPREVVESLRDVAKLIPIYTLPSQASEYTTRTAAHLRTMQYMSYFHLNLNLSISKGLGWNSVPLTSIRPWEICYYGENSGILGIMCYGEQPSANLLAETINGSLLQVVVIEEMLAIPGWTEEKTKSAPIAGQKQDEDMDNGFVSLDAVDEDPEIEVFDTDELHPSVLTKPLIITTPHEGLPYFNPENAISFDPSHSQALGLALIRGIDVARKRLHILTSIDTSVIQEINGTGKKIVLISGKLDTPGWAYTEELVQREGAEKQRRNTGDDGEEGEDDGDEDYDEKKATSNTIDDAFSETPWVERLEGSQGRGVGARVWRVRRDLGKTVDGGD